MPLYINIIKFQEKNLNLNRDSNSDLQISSLAMWQLFQEESFKVGWHENQDGSMVERQARDLEVRVRVPVQVQIFFLKFNRKHLFLVFRHESDDVNTVD